MAAARRVNPVDEALKLGTTPLLFAGLFSLITNLLFLAFPIYTQQVFGRVLMSHSSSTLFVLTGGILVVFALSGVIETLRARLMTNFGLQFDRYMASPMFNALFESAVRGNANGRAQVVRDLDTVRQGVSGPGMAVLFDAPFAPLFFFMLFIIDPALGLLTFVGGMVLLVLVVLQDRSTRSALLRSNDESMQAYAFTESALRNSEVVRALGMTSALGVQWSRHRLTALDRQAVVNDRSSSYSNAIKSVRMGIQVLTIALSAWLIVRGSVHSGLLFANMILAGRALAPIERVVGSWSVLVSAGESYRRLKALFEATEPPVPATALPVPKGELIVDRVVFSPPNANRNVLQGVAFVLPAGQTLGIVGASGAGKSTLLRLLVGVWKPQGGAVRLDGADVFSWERTSFGKYVGYLPQDVELFAGTIRDNIARFRPEATDEQVIGAANLAGAHELIVHMQKGYDTEIGDGGAVLSGGQRQRIALARALFGEPRLVVLDEPNSSLDSEGEEALLKAMEALKARGATVVIASHKPNIFRTSDLLMVMKDGRADAFGPRNEIMARLMKPAQVNEARTG